MRHDIDPWLGIADTFHSAAFGHVAWTAALGALGAATGSSHGALVCYGSARAVDLNLITGVESDYAEEFVAHGGGDPARNPRLRAAMDARLLAPYSDLDFMSPDAIANEPFYQDFLVRRDIPHFCAAVLDRSPTSVVAVGVGRTAAEGEIEAAQRRLFKMVAPHVRNAYLTQLALNDQGYRLVAGALGQLTIAAFICDEQRRVKATTPLGEAVASEESVLRIRRGYLAPIRHPDVEEFAAALRPVAQCRDVPGRPFARSLVVHDSAERPSVVDVIALPTSPGTLQTSPHMLVISRDHARRRHGPSDDTRTLQAAYRLAPAEAQVAVGIASGLTVEEIARNRGVAVATVRVQLRAVFEKMGVRRQADLIILVNRLR